MAKTMLVLFSLLVLVACSGLPLETQPTPQPTPPPTTIATIPPTATTAPTVPAPTTTPTPRAPGLRVAVLTVDNAVKLFALDGSSHVLTAVGTRLDRLNLNGATNAISTTIYARSTTSSPVVTVDAGGLHLLAAFKTAPTSAVVGESAGGRLAWGTYVVTGTTATTELFLGARDGLQAKGIVKKTAPTSQAPQALEPFRFSQDGTRLYYSYEPVGLGGYILFGGASDLWEYTASTGKSVQVVKAKQFGGSTCIDDLAPNEKLVVFHCGDKSIGVFDLRTSKSSTITLPAEAGPAKVLGTAHFSPDSTRVAFAAARHNPDDEQGWVLVSTGLTGASKVIAASPAKDYFEVIAWLNADTLLLQTHNPQPAVWTVRADGSGLQKLADGQFLSILANAP